MLKALKLLLAASSDVPGKFFGYVGYVNHLKLHIYNNNAKQISHHPPVFHKMLFNEGETVIFTWN